MIDAEPDWTRDGDSPVDYHYSQRGFKQFRPMFDENGIEYRVVESSTMSDDKELWLFMKDKNGVTAALLLDEELTRNLVDALRNHRDILDGVDLYGVGFTLEFLNGKALLNVIHKDAEIVDSIVMNRRDPKTPVRGNLSLKVTNKAADLLADTLEWASDNHWAVGLFNEELEEAEEDDHPSPDNGATSWASLRMTDSTDSAVILLDDNNVVVNIFMSDPQEDEKLSAEDIARALPLAALPQRPDQHWTSAKLAEEWNRLSTTA